MKTAKRFLSLVLTLVLAFGTLPSGVFAEMGDTVQAAEETQAVVLVLDGTSSLSSASAEAMKEASIQFCESVLAADPDCQIGVLELDNPAAVHCAMTSNLEALTQGINDISITTSYGTNITDSLERADTMLENVAADKKQIVLMTDGLPNNGAYTTTGRYTSEDYVDYEYANVAYDTAVAMHADRTIYTVGLLNSVPEDDLDFAQRFLEDLQNGGYFGTDNFEELIEIFTDLADIVGKNVSIDIDFRQIYTNDGYVCYMPTFYVNNHKDFALENAWLELECGIGGELVTLTGKPGDPHKDIGVLSAGDSDYVSGFILYVYPDQLSQMVFHYNVKVGADNLETITESHSVTFNDPFEITLSAERVIEESEQATYNIQAKVYNPNDVPAESVSILMNYDSTETPLGIEFLQTTVDGESIGLPSNSVFVASIAPRQSAICQWQLQVDKSGLTEAYNFEYTVTADGRNMLAFTQKGSIPFNVLNGEDNRLVFGTDTWGFNNFGDTKFGLISNDAVHEDYINDQDRNVLLTGGTAADRLALRDFLETDGAGGHCYGMATMTILDKMDIIDAEDYGAHTPLGNTTAMSDSLHSALCYYQSLQVTQKARALVQSFMSKAKHYADPNDKDDLIKTNYSMQLFEIALKADDVKNGGAPVLLSYGSDSWGAHAVVAYDVAKGSFTSSTTGKTYDSKILIYDNNEKDDDPAKTDDYSILYNALSGEWEIPAYANKDVSSASGKGYLKRCTNDLSEIDLRNYDIGLYNYRAEMAVKAKTPVKLNLLNGASYSLWDELNLWQHYYFDSESAEEGNQTLNIVLPDETAAYGLTTESGEAEALDYDLYYDDSYQSVTADAATGVAFDPAGKASVTGNAGSFEVALADNAITDSFDIYTITGDNPGNYTVETTDDGAYITGDDLENILISAEDENTEKDIAIDTDKTAVYVTDDNNELVVKIDNDGDGTFETEIAISDDAKRPGGYELGDIDESMSINAADALQALRHSVKEIELADKAFERGNVKKATNGQAEAVDASDALDILRYSVKEIDSFD